jgi:hypothetical protein
MEFLMNRIDFGLMASIAACVGFSGTAAGQEGVPASLRGALTFRASFDKGTDADFAKGDARLYTAESAKREDAKLVLPAGDVEVAEGKDRRGGGALRFIQKSPKVLFFKAAKNLEYKPRDWSGTASFWLSVDPNVDMGTWYCDPIQITDKTWNDACLFVDFSKDERPKLFRLGVFADMKVWNPAGKDFEKMSPVEKPMANAAEVPFRRGKWTHVAVTFEKFNTGKPDGAAKLYLDGKLQASVAGRNQQFTWDVDKAAVQIGMSYVGLFDDLALFNRSLDEAEVKALHAHEGLRDAQR